ncbi:MAG: hypothetical protein ACHQRK_07000 [Gemmatimonadales bacterium]|jgi:hypothetical protein
MIRHRDFTPRRIPGGILHADRYESFDQAVAAAQEWIDAGKIDVVSMETVVLPNIWSHDEEGTTDASVETAQAMTSVNEWNQFLRVWYRD